MQTANVKLTAIVTTIAMLIGTLTWMPASAQTWTNTNPEGGSWFDENNWSTSAIPTNSTNVIIANGGTAIIDTGAADVGQFRVGNSAGDVGHLIINNDLRTYTHATYFANDGGTASIVQNSGAFVAGWVNDTTFRDAFFGSSAGTFAYTMNGGSFEVKRYTYLRGENSLWTVNNGTVSLNSDFVMGLGSQFVLNGGTVNARDLKLSTSTLHINGGTFNITTSAILGTGANDNVAIYQTGGTVNASAIQYFNIGNWTADMDGQSILYEISGGTLTTQNLRVRPGTANAHFRVVGSNIDGINITTFNDWHLATTSVREFILDNGSSHITTIQASAASQALAGELRLGLQGGVMLSGVDSFHLLEAASFSGDWTATPSALWTTDIAENVNGARDAVRITLDANYYHDTLDSSVARNHLSLSPSTQGYIVLENVAGDLLEIGLDFGEAGADFDLGDLDSFKSGLTDAGIDWTTGYGVYEVGLFLDPSVSGGEYFVWDLTDYGTLELHGIANVIPEPSSLVLLALAGLALMRRRRR